MNVADILHRKGAQVVTIRSTEPVRAAVEKLAANRIGALVTRGDDGDVTGILSERDVVRGLADNGPDVLDHPVSTLMSRRLHVCGPDDDLRDILSRMTDLRIRHLPVVDGDQLRGIVSIGDVVKYRLDEVQTEARVLRDIVITNR